MVAQCPAEERFTIGSQSQEIVTPVYIDAETATTPEFWCAMYAPLKEGEEGASQSDASVDDGFGDQVLLGASQAGPDASRWLKKAVDVYDDAIQAYDRSLKLNPRSPEAWSMKGEILLKKGDYFDALGCFNQSLEIDSKIVSS
jgi:tetratricopeptide (TPR) repeat protein